MKMSFRDRRNLRLIVLGCCFMGMIVGFFNLSNPLFAIGIISFSCIILFIYSIFEVVSWANERDNLNKLYQQKEEERKRNEEELFKREHPKEYAKIQIKNKLLSNSQSKRLGMYAELLSKREYYENRLKPNSKEQITLRRFYDAMSRAFVRYQSAILSVRPIMDKPIDPMIAGGIAQGIGGIGAGIYAASEASVQHQAYKDSVREFQQKSAYSYGVESTVINLYVDIVYTIDKQLYTSREDVILSTDGLSQAESELMENYINIST